MAYRFDGVGWIKSKLGRFRTSSYYFHLHLPSARIADFGKGHNPLEKILWALPIVQMLWVNMHGLFVLGLLLQLSYFLPSLLGFLVRRIKKQSGKDGQKRSSQSNFHFNRFPFERFLQSLFRPRRSFPCDIIHQNKRADTYLQKHNRRIQKPLLLGYREILQAYQLLLFGRVRGSELYRQL